jgi:hypothetical protein
VALNVAQVEEIGALLRQVPRLVDLLEAHAPGFADAVLAWLKQAEAAMENNRLPVVSQVAACRAMLIGAARGLHGKDIVFAGRATPRKVHEATASLALDRGNQLLHGAIAERQAVFQDAERIAGQLVTVADAKGHLRDCGASASHQHFLECLQQKITGDADLMSAYTHLVAMVGKNDVLVFLDRALPRVA